MATDSGDGLPCLPAPFTHRLRVRYSECDQQNVVFNGDYLFSCDVAMTELWRACAGQYTAMVQGGESGRGGSEQLSKSVYR